MTCSVVAVFFGGGGGGGRGQNIHIATQVIGSEDS